MEHDRLILFMLLEQVHEKQNKEKYTEADFNTAKKKYDEFLSKYKQKMNEV